MSIDKQAAQVQRYANFGVDMMEWAEGGYVKHSDYLALLDELEAKGKLIAGQAAFIVTQEKWIKGVEETMISATDRAEAAEKRIAELTAPDGNAIAWESTALPYIKFITDERYQKLRPGYQKWYKPYRCSNCAAGISVKGE